MSVFLRVSGPPSHDSDSIVIDLARWQISRDGLVINLDAPAFIVATGLLANGGMVRMGDLIDAVYGHRRDGGPETIQSAIYHLVSRARTALRSLGIEITVAYRFGWQAEILPLSVPERLAA